MSQPEEDPEFPTRAGDLSTYAIDHAIDTLRKECGGQSELVDKALATISLLIGRPRSGPWYGAMMKLSDRDHVEMGTVLRNAFEALGDGVDVLVEGGGIKTLASSWFTQHYAEPWRQGKKDYYDWLRMMDDPLAYEREQEAARMTAEQAEAEYARVNAFLRRTS